MCDFLYYGRVRILHLLFYCIGPPVGVNVSAGLGEPLLGVSPPLEVAPLLVVTTFEVSPPLDVSPFTRSRVFSAVQVLERLVLGFKVNRT